jgi:tetratricopeptide (TPR) repeat protein
LFTKDDNQPFHLTGSQIGSVTVNLSAKALTAWQQGVALANTPEEKAHAYYIQGWGIRVLRQYLEKNHASHGLRAELTASGIILKDMPTYENMLVAFDKAIEAAPQNPLYWQAKGDALGDGKEATAPYEKALDLKPRNATSLWYHLYRLVAPTSYEKPENETWVLAAEYLRKAKARDRGNAWPLYEEAVLKFCYAPYIMTAHDRNRITTPQVQEERRKAVRNEDARRNARLAIDLILQGNRAPRYEPPRYVDSVPNLLAVAWEWRHFSFQKEDSEGFARSRELARSCGAYAKFMAGDEKDGKEAVRAGWAAVGMGHRLMDDWPTRDDPVSGKTVMIALVGWAVTTISYKHLLATYEILEDNEHYGAVSAESAAFGKRSEEYQSVINAYRSRNWIESY